MKCTLKIAAVIFLSLVAYGCSERPSNHMVVEETDVKASAAPAFGVAPLTVQFGSSGRVVSGGSTVTYAWNFDDGNKSDEPSPEHTFEFIGTYVVELTVTDVSGVDYTDWVVVIVN